MLNLYILDLIKWMGLLEFMMELPIQYYLEVKNMVSFTTVLFILQEGVKSGITYVISHNYTKIKVDSYNSLPLEKTVTFHNIIILIKSVFNKDKNRYYCNIFLEKASYESPKNKFWFKI